MTRRRLAAAGLWIVCLAVILRPAVVKTDHGSRLLVLLRWQSGRIQFVNSVTDKPVAIDFRIGSLFDHFAMRTDPATEDYYTNGLYSMNEAVSSESTDSLRFCSMKGIHVTLGSYELDSRDGCLEVKLLWTTCFGGSCM